MKSAFALAALVAAANAAGTITSIDEDQARDYVVESCEKNYAEFKAADVTTVASCITGGTCEGDDKKISDSIESAIVNNKCKKSCNFVVNGALPIIAAVEKAKKCSDAANKEDATCKKYAGFATFWGKYKTESDCKDAAAEGDDSGKKDGAFATTAMASAIAATALLI